MQLFRLPPETARSCAFMMPATQWTWISPSNGGGSFARSSRCVRWKFSQQSQTTRGMLQRFPSTESQPPCCMWSIQKEVIGSHAS